MNNAYEKPFDVMVLDSDYNVIGMAIYDNIQWSRKCTEPGTFSIKLTIDQYTSDWCYVYSPDRRELGKISQLNMNYDNNGVNVTISGQFIEEELNKMVVYPLPSDFWGPDAQHASILDTNPSWLNKKGTADQVALQFFNGFKSISYKGYDIEDTTGANLKTRTYALDIDEGEVDTGDYKISNHFRNGEPLGKKITSILKPSFAFYQVDYDHQTGTKTFNIRHGRDLTSQNTGGNNPVVFSTQNGTIAKASLVKSNTNTRDVAISFFETDEKTEVLVNGYNDATGRFLPIEQLPDDFNYSTDLDYKLAASAQGANQLSNYQDVINISFSVFDGSYDYMVDFDLGDVVSVDVPELELFLDAQIIGCYEVVKNGVWSLDLEFGTPIKRR